MTKFKIHITLVIFFLLNIIVFAQDVKLRIPKTSINKTAEAFIKAKYLSYGSVDDGNFIEYYSLKPQSAAISLQQGNVFTITLNVDFNANFNYSIFDFGYNNNANIDLVGTIQMQSTENGYKVILHPVSINSTLSGTLGDVLNYASSGILSHYNEICINTNQFYLPNILSEYFTATEPVLSTDEDGITLSLILKAGSRYITALNDVNQMETIGKIENEEGVNNYIPYDSPKTFEWNTGDTHKIQSPVPLLDADNGKNKYSNWYDDYGNLQNEIYPRRIQISVGVLDDTYKANFLKAQHVQLSNALEGSLSGGTVTYQNSIGQSSTGTTYNDYDFKTGVGVGSTNVPNGTLGTNWIWQGWSDGNTSQSRNIILNSDVNVAGNYKGHLFTNSANATSSNN